MFVFTSHCGACLVLPYREQKNRGGVGVDTNHGNNLSCWSFLWGSGEYKGGGGYVRGNLTCRSSSSCVPTQRASGRSSLQLTLTKASFRMASTRLSFTCMDQEGRRRIHVNMYTYIIPAIISLCLCLCLSLSSENVLFNSVTLMIMR